MSTPNRPVAELADSPQEGEVRQRKQYQPPRILSREPLEALANVCTAPGSKSGPDAGCTLGPPQS